MSVTSTVYISNQPVAVLRGEITIKHSSDLRSTCDFVVQDPTGIARYSERQPVRVEDVIRGRRFSGYINTVKYENLNPNPDNQISLSCVNESDLAAKAFARRDYINQDAGDIGADLHNNYLAGLGITAKYAMRHDSSATQFGLGALTNVAGTTNIDNGDLELAPAGTTVTITETSTSDFATGTLTNTVAANNALGLVSVQALQMTATSQQGANNNYTYFKLWTGSVGIVSGDKLVYTIWVSSSSPQATGGIDLAFDNGRNARDMNVFDQNGLYARPWADLSGYGVDKWYQRSIGLSPDANGINCIGMSIGQEGDNNGTYTFYVRDVKIVDISGTLKQQLMTNGTPSQTPTQQSDLGYSGAKLTTITGYTDTGTRVSPSRSISAAGIVRSSIVSWTQSVNGVVIANATQGPDKVNYTSVESSVDGGATWQACTNHRPIPNLYAGMSASGISVLFRQTIRVAGPDPTIPVNLNDFTMTALPSYSTTVSNIQNAYNNTNWGSSGTYSNTMTGTTGDLNLNGVYRNWYKDINPTGNITLFGTNPADNIFQPNSCLLLRCDAQGDARARLDDAGSWGDCTIEVDLELVDATGNYGVEYGTTSWNNTNNTYAYNAYIDATGVTLGRGSNGGAGSYIGVSSASIPLTTGQWYHIKIIHASTNHKIYVNDVKYIDVNDATYTSPGGIALRHFNSNVAGGARHAGFFQNFGVIQNPLGTWISTGVSLSSLGTFGASSIQWNDDTPANATLLIEASIDNGVAYTACTNNAPLPSVVLGASASGKTLKLRASLSAQNANVTPNLHGLSVLISSAYSASGSRVSPALSLSNAGVAGSANVQWNAIVPTNTTLNLDSSPDGSTWTLAGSGASGNVAIPNIVTQQDPIDDSFDSDTSASYTSSARTGGSAGGWSWNVSQSRLDGSNSGAVLLLNSISAKDVDLIADMRAAENTGVVWRWTNASNFYELVVRDASASSSSNTIALYKTVSGTRTQIGSSASISFVRTMPYRVRLTMVGIAITAYFEGTQILSATDISLAGGGSVGMHTTGTASFYQFRAQALGQNVVGQFLYTRTRLASTDPTATPQLQDLTLSVRSPQLVTGALIPEAHYSVLTGSTNTLFDDYTDLSKQSNALWDIDYYKALSFVDRAGMPAPWIVTSDDMQAKTQVSVETNGHSYRNREILSGGIDTLARVESVIGDGITQTWPTSYRVQSISSITVNGVAATWGIQGVDSGKTFYYTPGEVGFSQDSSLTPYDVTQMPTIAYDGIATATVILSDDVQIAQLAAIDKTDGIIESGEDVSQQNIGILAMLQLAESRLIQYAKLAHTISFTTLRPGLMPNQIAPVFLPAYQIQDSQYLIASVSEHIDAISTEYDIQMTDGAEINDYQHYLVSPKG